MMPCSCPCVSFSLSHFLSVSLSGWLSLVIHIICLFMAASMADCRPVFVFVFLLIFLFPQGSSCYCQLFLFPTFSNSPPVCLSLCPSGCLSLYTLTVVLFFSLSLSVFLSVSLPIFLSFHLHAPMSLYHLSLPHGPCSAEPMCVRRMRGKMGKGICKPNGWK